MALLWVDGFEQYGAQGAEVTPVAAFYSRYNAQGVSTINIVAGRDGSAMLFDSSSPHIATPALTTNGTLIAGVAFTVNRVNVNACLMDFQHTDGDGDAIGYNTFGVWIESQNLAIRIGNTTLNSVNCTLSANTWYYLEFKVFSDDSSGTAEVRLNGAANTVNYAGDTNFGTGWEEYVQVGLRGAPTGVNIKYDDFYVADASGSTCNDFLGDCTVYTLYPDGDASGNMTANSGTDEYAMVNGATTNTSNYIKDTATGNRCVFTYGALPITPNTVYGVQVTSECNLSANLMKGLKNITQNGSGTVNIASPAYPVSKATTYYGTVTDVYEVNADNAAWTPALLNDARFGVQVE